MVMPALRKRHWTVADVRALIDETRHWPRYELLEGELLVTPAPVPRHQLAVSELLLLVGTYCKREGIGIALTSPADIELAPESIMQPDLFVVPDATFPEGEALEWPQVKELLLAVEVLSSSSIRQDRITKREFYLANHVDEYWIVDLDARIFERWTPERSTPDLRRDDVTWLPRGAVAPLVIDVQEFFQKRVRLPRRI